MSNIVMTTECNRNCPYCFASNSVKNHMVFQKTNFKKAIDWIAEDNTGLVSRIGIIGGEPTKHPRFAEFLGYVLSKKLNTIVFTNGMLSDSIIFSIVDTAVENKVSHSNQLSFCINLNEPKFSSDSESRLQGKFLSILGKVTSVSFNIYRNNFDPYFIIDTIQKYNMVRNIRLGLAMPLGNKNKYLPPNSYVEVAERIVEFLKVASDNGITTDFDCGFVKCMFSEQQLESLYNSSVKTLSFDCGPSIDIYPNLEATGCYPLAHALRENISNFKSYRELHKYWQKEISLMSPTYEKCASCMDYTYNRCHGGCKAHNING